MIRFARAETGDARLEYALIVFLAAVVIAGARFGGASG